MTNPNTAPVEQVELSPCPFCGEQPTLKVKDGGLGVILCPETSPCFGSGFGNFIRMEQRDEAIAAWNTRATTAALQARVEALEAMGCDLLDLEELAEHATEPLSMRLLALIDRARAALNGEA